MTVALRTDKSALGQLRVLTVMAYLTNDKTLVASKRGAVPTRSMRRPGGFMHVSFCLTAPIYRCRVHPTCAAPGNS
jgi:hypothetical protein